MVLLRHSFALEQAMFKEQPLFNFHKLNHDCKTEEIGNRAKLAK